MKPFRERNPVVIGFIGIALIALFLVSAFRADDLPLIGGGDTYHAEFTEIGGLKVGNEVRVVGISVGKVKEIELVGDRVKVTFKINQGTDLGSETRAAIKIRTLLGAEFLALDSAGAGDLKKGSIIPSSRTTAPYDVVEAFSDLSETVSDLDTDKIAEALQTVGDIASQTPRELRGALRGVSALSRNLAARDTQINTLLVNLKKVTGVLNSRQDELETIFKDSTVLFDAISSRRDQIHSLLVSTQHISAELRGLVKDTQGDLKPALEQLDAVTAMLRRNQYSLDEAIRVLPAFLRVFANALGNGPWFDTYVKVG